MATPEQIQTMLDLMTRQMARLEAVEIENAQLRQNTEPSTPGLSSGQREPKKRRPDRPVIEANLSDSDWALFIDTWSRYKAMTAISDVEELRMELRAACSPDVNKLLFEFVGPSTLNAATEIEMLDHIKSVAVKGVHKEVHRMNFSKIRQGDGENITHYVARLKSQASLCSFVIKCRCEESVSYAEEMVAQQLVAGLRNHDHQAKILSEATFLTSLKLKVDRLQSLEATDESAIKLHAPIVQTNASAAKSSYKQIGASKKTPDGSKKKFDKPCTTCGLSDHYGRSISFKDCPAAKKKCNSCGKEGHFTAVCRSKTSKSAASTNEEEEEIEQSEASTSYFFVTKASCGDTSQQAKKEQYFRLSRPMTPDG